ncbi:hypothetical protein ACQP2P_13475 [Dactylosporangium sp. CA-139114]
MNADAARAIERAGYVRLTTYRKDGTPVPAPVWHACCASSGHR